MKSNLATIALTIMLMAAWGIECHAGAWTASKYSFYNKLAFNYYFSDQTFDSSRDRVDTASNGEFDDFNISNYFEFGLTDDLTVINSFAYKWLENDTDQVTSKAHGIGDIDLGARYKLLDNAAGIVSAQYLMKIPGGYSKNDLSRWATPQCDHEFRLLYGRSLYVHPRLRQCGARLPMADWRSVGRVSLSHRVRHGFYRAILRPGQARRHPEQKERERYRQKRKPDRHEQLRSRQARSRARL